MSRHMKMPIVASLLALGVLGGCQSTPEHTNTLIFGTNTKFALDVSQDPTGVVGVTLGYKRQEAVWMPLLANSRAAAPATAASAATPAEPAGCKDSTVMKIEEGGKTTTRTSGCKFSGTAGTDSTNGPGAEDTYWRRDTRDHWDRDGYNPQGGSNWRRLSGAILCHGVSCPNTGRARLFDCEHQGWLTGSQCHGHSTVGEPGQIEGGNRRSGPSHVYGHRQKWWIKFR
jgi:hypothetical protein